MRLLLSGYHNPHFPTITEYMEDAIHHLGHDLIVFDDRKYLFPGRFRERLPWLHRFDAAHLNQKLIRLAMGMKPDIAIITGGHRIAVDTIKSLKRLGIITVLWTIDAPHDFQPIIEVAPYYDHIFCQGTEAIELLEQAGIKGANWLPMACDPLYHHPVTVPDPERTRYAHDIAFVGSYYPNRADLFATIAHLDLAIWGPGWNIPKRSSPLKRCIQGLHTLPSEWLKIYSSAHIVLASHYQDPERRFPVYQASPRIFEALACGAFVLSDDQRDVFSLFNDGQHLARFSNAGELEEKVLYYLNHPEERHAIAEKGQEEVLKNHTYGKRIEELLSLIQRPRS